jgi:Rieske Fe-S protein
LLNNFGHGWYGVLTNECGYQGAVEQAPFSATRTGDVPPGVTVADTATVLASPTASAPTPLFGGPVLDGTFRVDYDQAHQTANGAQTTGGDPGFSEWWAFRSSCTSTGCVATGTKLDDNNHQVASTPAHTAEFHFVNGSWQRTPAQFQEQYPRCLGADGKVVAGAHTQTVAWSLEPQPGGTLQGVQTQTEFSAEPVCGWSYAG